MVNKVKDASTEERILDAAQKIFIKKGMFGARTQDIADEAGINKALLHYYFKNKEQLFEVIFTRLTQGFWAQLTAIFESDDPLYDKIHAFCSVYIDKVLANPYIPLFILYELNQRPADFVKKLFSGTPPRPGKLMMQVAEEVKAGNIHPIEPSQLVINMLSLCVLPFIGKPLFMNVLNMDEKTYTDLLIKRKKDVPEFIINSIKK